MITKLVVALAAVFSISSSAQAGDLMTVLCMVASEYGSIGTKPTLRSGFREDIVCERGTCMGADDFAIVMNYNGNSYEDMTIEITHKPTGLMASTTYHDLRVGSEMNLALGNGKNPRFGLGLDCEVTAVTMKPTPPTPAASAAKK